MENRKSNYAWVILAACCLIVFGGAGLVFSTAGVFYTVVADAFGVGKGVFSLYMTIVILVMSLSLPVTRKLIVKMDIRKIIAIDGICLSLSWAIFAMSRAMWMFYAAAVLQGFGVAGPMYNLVPTMASRWFHKKNGMMIGLSMAFTGIAGIILQPVLGSVIASAGWRAGYWINTAVAAVCVIIPSVFLLRSNPEDIGQVPYGYEEKTDASGTVTPTAITGVPISKAMKSSTFYMMAVLSICINLYTCLNFYLASYATAIGYSLTAATAISSVAMYGQLLGKVGLGTISDKSLNLGMIPAFLCGAVGLIVLLATHGTAPVFVLFLSIFLYGITHAGAAVETPIVAKACFGIGKDYAQIWANLASIGTFVSAFGSTLFGFIVDWTGSYHVLFAIGIGLSVLSFVMAKLSLTASKKLERE